ncbi:MAG: DUF2828 family protein, partial [Lachnospiraceae bacterium]|nr:DUF2828 family protein [Lachnospiraceae bacterium]
ENGAITYGSTMSHCLDFFATVGGMRNAKDSEIIKSFIRAYAENADVAMKMLFYARDIRQGLGERRIFKVILKDLCWRYPESVKKNLEYISYFGRYDDFLVLIDTPCEREAIGYLKEVLNRDVEAMNKDSSPISLLAKWLPSVNTSNKEKVYLGKKLAKAFGMKEKEYRQTLSALRKKIDILENHLREADYSFSYEKQPGNAMLKYRKAFQRHDKERYEMYLASVKKGECRMHTQTLMPYEIIRPLYRHNISTEEAEILDVTWNALEDFAGDSNTLIVADGSGSMYSGVHHEPITVAHSLALYFSERNKGTFANHFITFSSSPKLVEIKGKTLKERVNYISTFDEIADTNLQAVFELILHTAVKKQITQSEMPERIIIVSDMEFNYCTQNSSLTNFEYAKCIFERAGYKLPKVVFWNVASRNHQVPVSQNEQGVILVSGTGSKLFEQVMTDAVNPYSYMMEIIGSERYEKIAA